LIELVQDIALVIVGVVAGIRGTVVVLQKRGVLR